MLNQPAPEIRLTICGRRAMMRSCCLCCGTTLAAVCWPCCIGGAAAAAAASDTTAQPFLSGCTSWSRPSAAHSRVSAAEHPKNATCFWMPLAAVGCAPQGSTPGWAAGIRGPEVASACSSNTGLQNLVSRVQARIKLSWDLLQCSSVGLRGTGLRQLHDSLRMPE